MPYLKIQTNQPIEETTRTKLLQQASKVVSQALGKPESYVMVALDPTIPMMFAGNDHPCTYLEMKSIGLPESKTGTLSEALCQLMEKELGIPPNRTYIEFTDAPRAMWGWDRSTF
jgi:phenylpyruvate tautomerase